MEFVCFKKSCYRPDGGGNVVGVGDPTLFVAGQKDDNEISI